MDKERGPGILIGLFMIVLVLFSAYFYFDKPSLTGKSIYRPDGEVISRGYSAYLLAGDSIDFNYFGEHHYLRLEGVEANRAVISSGSLAPSFSLGIRESRKVNLDQDNFYDLFVRIDDIKDGGSVLVYVISIREATSESSADDFVEQDNTGLNDIDIGFIKFEGYDKTVIKYLIISVILLLVVSVAVITLIYWKKIKYQKKIREIFRTNPPRPPSIRPSGWRVD